MDVAPVALRALLLVSERRILDAAWPEIGAQVWAFLANSAVEMDAVLGISEAVRTLFVDGVPKLAREVRLLRETSTAGYVGIGKRAAWGALHADFWAAIARYQAG